MVVSFLWWLYPLCSTLFYSIYINFLTTQLISLWSHSIFCYKHQTAYMDPLTRLHTFVRVSKLAALNSYAKRQNNQQLYCWLPDSIYADYGNSGKQAYTLTHSRTAQYGTERNSCGVVPIPNPWMCESPYMATPRANLGTCHQLGLNSQPASPNCWLCKSV